MKVIVCVDDEMGMLFNHRRQSRDQVLNQYLLQLCGDSPLLMNAYSAPLFADAPNVKIREDFLEAAGEEDFCFVENQLLRPYEEKINTLVVCHWNRRYPGDSRLDLDLSAWTLHDAREFSGSSHEKITVEVYNR